MYNTKTFIEKAKLIHGDKYDYSKTIYKKSSIKVTITCKKHGDFEILPSEHLRGVGCNKCAKENYVNKNFENFILKARQIHGWKYDYSKVDYKGMDKKVRIICPEHGEFWQTPNTHINSFHGCQKCGNESCVEKNKVANVNRFFRKAKEIHGNKYDYSKVKYVDTYTPVTIICPIHGEFQQRPINHVSIHVKAGCPECGRLKCAPLTTEEFINKAKKVHGNKYDYSKVKYVNNETKVTIICPKHGEFSQKPANHIHSKSGCPLCGLKALTTEEFIQKAREIHGNKYDYSKTKYVNMNTPVCIIHPEYGEFWQKPDRHLHGTGYNKSLNFNIYTYDYCYNIALKYKTLKDFRLSEPRVYDNSREKGYLKDFTWLKRWLNSDIKSQYIYSYEFNDHSVYVGLTNDINRRDWQHRNRCYHKSGLPMKDTVLDYAESKGVEVPEVKIILSAITKSESQIEEQHYIDKYREEGWNVLNKVKGGSLGASYIFNTWTKESIIEEAKKYTTKTEMRNHSRTAYNKMMNMGDLKKFVSLMQEI